MPGVKIVSPRPNVLLPAGKDFTVSGIAFDRGWPEPITIETVVVSVDGSPGKEAVLTPGQPSTQTIFNFSAVMRAPMNTGAHLLSVTAVNDLGRSGKSSATFYIGVGPMPARFGGTSTLKTTHPRDTGPHVSQFAAGLLFSANRRTVTLTFPETTDESSPSAGVTVTITVNLIGGGIGSFDPTIGSFEIPIVLNFRVRVLVSGVPVSDTTSTLDVTLSTGSQSSPTGAYSDTGVAMDTGGGVVLIADGQFTGGELGGSDASLVIAGKVAPRP